MGTKYKEIFRLKKMLEDAHIPFDWEESFGYGKHDLEKLKRIAPDLIEHYHIMYPHRGDLQICSVIEGFGTYGGPNDSLEIMGLLTSEEATADAVEGYLTAEDVFNRIKKHYDNEKERNITIMKKIKTVDEDTLEIKEVEVKEDAIDTITDMFQKALNCDSEEFYQKYRDYKKAEADFNALYEPFKSNLIKLHEQNPDLPKSIIIGGVKLTYVSPSVRSSIDSKKLKEEEPDLVKKYTKTTNVKANIRLETTMVLN